MAVGSDVDELLTLQAVRRQARKVLAAAEKYELVNFFYDADKMPEVADFVMGVISVGVSSPSL